MIVLHVTKNEVTATYNQNPKKRDFDNPKETIGYTRPHSGFTIWDGKPINWSYKKMAKQYEVAGAGRCGTYLTKTSQGDFVLEFPDGSTEHFAPCHLIEIIPFTFLVEDLISNAGGYKSQYSLLQGQTVNQGDLLVSDFGNLYRVLEVDTKFTGSLKQFRGKRFVTQDL